MGTAHRRCAHGTHGFGAGPIRMRWRWEGLRTEVRTCARSLPTGWSRTSADTYLPIASWHHAEVSDSDRCAIRRFCLALERARARAVCSAHFVLRLCTAACALRRMCKVCTRAAHRVCTHGAAAAAYAIRRRDARRASSGARCGRGSGSAKSESFCAAVAAAMRSRSASENGSASESIGVTWSAPAATHF